MKRLLLATVSVFGICAAALPGQAQAQSAVPNINQIDAQIAQLQAEVAILKAQRRSDHAAMLQAQQQAKLQMQADANARLADAAKQEVVKKLPSPTEANMLAESPTGFQLGLGVKLGSKTDPKPLVGGIPIFLTPGGAFFLAGTFDAGARYDFGTHTRSVFSVNSGEMRLSRIDFEGYQNVGFGLRATTVLEGGLNFNNGYGASEPPGSVGTGFQFGTNSTVGIGSDKYGYLAFGRTYTPIWSVSAGPAGDVYGGSYLGGSTILYPTTARTNRDSNSISWAYGYGWEGLLNPAPFVGLGAALIYSPGDQSSANPINSGRSFGGSLSYGVPKFYIGGGYQQVDGANSTDTAALSPYVPATPNTLNLPSSKYGTKPVLTEVTLETSFKIPYARMYGGVHLDNNGVKLAMPKGGVDSRSWYFGFVVPLAPHQVVKLMYGQEYDLTQSQADYSTFQASYEYDLTKMIPGTALYLEGGLVSNNKNSAIMFNGTHNVSGTGLLVQKNGTTIDYGGTGDTIASGVRYIF
jgi:predicted porin